MGESSLDFQSSELFRKKLVTRNLKPYNVEGAFDYSVTNPYYETNVVDNSVVDSQSVSVNINKTAQQEIIPNVFGPTGGFENAADVLSINTQPTSENSSNQLEYWPLQNETNMDLINEPWIDLAQVVNRFIPNDGYEGMYYADTKILPKNEGVKEYNPLNLPFVVGNYSLADIVFGNDNLVQQDSYLLQISVLELRKAFQYRIAQELLQTSVANNLSINSNPLQSSLLATNQTQLSYLDYHITVPDGVLDFTADLAQRITGLYLPFSPIEGDYFDFSPRQPRTGLGRFVQRLSNNDSSASVKFLANTGGGQKSILFANLDYNRYTPFYDRNITRAGQIINNIFGDIGRLEQDDAGSAYVGGKDELRYITSPANETPFDAYGNPTASVVIGPDAVGKLYEGDQNFNFGLNDNNTEVGGFVWLKKDASEIGTLFGPEGKQFGTDDSNNRAINLTERYASTDYDFRKGSILDTTQRLIDSTPASGLKRRLHAGNAINQTSKVFNDGYKELTKGSKVIRYQNVEGKLVGREYARVFTKDKPYQQFKDLQSTVGYSGGTEINGNIRKFSNSVLDTTYNLNIAPIGGEGSTNVVGLGNLVKVKKYMFSIENLAWKGSDLFEDLPACEKGPNGGRIMWFPPYNLEFSETISADFDSTPFLGRPEPIYTYKGSSRSGSLSFSIVVDHPSVLNLIAKKQLQNDTLDKTESVIQSFFAGATKFDLYELARNFATLDMQTLKQLQESVLSSNSSSAEQQIQVTNDLSTNESLAQELPSFSDFVGYGAFFPTYDVTIGSTNYEVVYENYIGQEPQYANTSFYPQTQNLFTNITTNYDKLYELRSKVLEAVTSQNCEVIIYVDGVVFQQVGPDASEIRNKAYVESVKLFFSDFSDSNNQKLGKFIQDGTVKFLYSDLLKTKAFIKTGNETQEVNCSVVLQNSGLTYSLEAMASRYISFPNITVTPKAPSNSNAGSNTTTESLANQNATTGNPTPSPSDIQKKNLSKRLLRTKLLNECDYFEVLKQTDPFAYQSVKDKVKFFTPAFHAITPEGLNSRLTFINQCVRPGKTIPTINEQGERDFTTSAFNTNFGTPPILVIRIGDFYNTKAIPDNIQLTFENLDINPEGIGLQPMIAKVTMGLKFIGGSGLAGPIDKLQNALSFNYYANTEMYDERADATEDTQALDEYLFDKIIYAEPLPNFNDIQNIPETNTTIGNILTTVASGLTQTGTIEYKTFFDNFVNSTQNYFTTTLNFIESSIKNYNYGVYAQMCYNRNFSLGTISLSGGTNIPVNIYGKPSQINQNLTSVATQLKTDIDNDNETIIIALNESPGLENLDISRVKNNYKNLIDSKLSSAFTNVNSDAQVFANKQAEYIQNIRKLNSIVGGQLDGKILANGAPKGYLLTIDNTFNNDYSTVSSGITEFYNLLISNQYLPTGTTSPYFQFNDADAQGGIINDSENLLFTLFYDDFKDQNKTEQFINALTTNLVSATSAQTIDVVTSQVKYYIVPKLTTWYDAIVNDFNKFKTNPPMNKFLNYNPTNSSGQSIKGVDRIYNYNTSGATETQLFSLRTLFSTVNSNNDVTTFDGKKTFN